MEVDFPRPQNFQIRCQKGVHRGSLRYKNVVASRLKTKIYNIDDRSQNELSKIKLTIMTLLPKQKTRLGKIVNETLKQKERESFAYTATFATIRHGCALVLRFNSTACAQILID